MIGAEKVQGSFRRGMFQPDPETGYPPDAVQHLVNGWVDDNASIRTRSGPLVLGPDQYADPRGGIRFYSETGSAGTLESWVVFAERDLITSFDAWQTTAVRETDVIAAGDQYVAMATARVQGVNNLFFVNGGQLMRWNGLSVQPVPDAPSGFVHLATFNSRLYGATGEGNLLHGSAIDDPLNWTAPDAIVLPIVTFEGDDTITGLLATGSVLLVFKRHSTNYVDGFGRTDIIVAAGARGVAKSVGCVGGRTAIPLEAGAAAWLSLRGFEFWSPGSDIQPLSAPINPFIMDVVDWNDILRVNPSFPNGNYEPHRRIGVWALPALNPSSEVTVVWRAAKPEIQMPSSFSLFIDTPGELGTAQLFMGVVDGDERLVRLRGVGDAVLFDAPLGVPGSTEPELHVITRLETFDVPTRRKRNRYDRLVAEPLEESATLRIRPWVVDEGGSRVGPEKIRTLPAQHTKVRVSEKGYGHALDIRTTDKVRIRAASLSGEVLEEAFP